MKKLIVILFVLLAAVGVWWRLTNTSTTKTTSQVSVAIEGNPSTVDPPAVMDVHSSQVATAVHSPLMWVASDGSLMPMVAKAMTMSTDAKRLEIELFPSASFWDGSPVSTADVIYTLERYRRSPHLHRWILDRVSGVKEFDGKTADHISGLVAESPSKMRVQFAEPEPDAPLMLCNLSVSIVKKGSGELPAQPFGVQVVGCGPYAPSVFNPTSFECVRKSANSLMPAVLTFNVVQDDQARLDGFRRGEVDVLRLRGPMVGEATQMIAGKLQPLASTKRGTVSVFPANELTYTIVNWSSPKLAAISPEHRREVVSNFSSAIDRDLLTLATLPSICAEPTSSIAPPLTGAVTRMSIAPPKPGTPQIPQPLTLLAANDSASRQLAIALQKQLASKGIWVETEFVDLGKLIGRLIEKQFDLMLFWIELQVASSGPYAWCSFFDKQAPLSAFGEARDDTSSLLAEARGIPDNALRANAFRNVVSLINDRQQSWVPLMSRKAVVLHTPGVAPWFDINGTPVNGLIRKEH